MQHGRRRGRREQGGCSLRGVPHRIHQIGKKKRKGKKKKWECADRGTCIGNKVAQGTRAQCTLGNFEIQMGLWTQNVELGFVMGVGAIPIWTLAQ